jgi:hypothetical protein
MNYRYGGNEYDSLGDLYKDLGIDPPGGARRTQRRRSWSGGLNIYGTDAQDWDAWGRNGQEDLWPEQEATGDSSSSGADDTGMRDDADEVEDRADDLNDEVEDYNDDQLDEVEEEIAAPPPPPEESVSASDLLIANEGDQQGSTHVVLQDNFKRAKRRNLLTIPGA